MKKRSTAINEAKTRLDDEEWEALELFAEVHGLDSVASALRRCVRQMLFGAVGSLPARAVTVRDGLGGNGTRQ